ncbi:hypothetical protein QFC19_003032 [Naganishia cerealis]|uniref:Uncharacterized protein n=1 Tax=Naganishia cerealis TaxID=610337 RepID=A0ACC2W4P7_9TREE|nr:hypothetical protein QFC19_003032 [Naganishia cerealis]
MPVSSILLLLEKFQRQYSYPRFSLQIVFGGETFDIAPEDFLELGQVPTNPMYCIGGIIANDGLPSEYLLYVNCGFSSTRRDPVRLLT